MDRPIDTSRRGKWRPPSWCRRGSRGGSRTRVRWPTCSTRWSAGSAAAWGIAESAAFPSCSVTWRWFRSPPPACASPTRTTSPSPGKHRTTAHRQRKAAGRRTCRLHRRALPSIEDHAMNLWATKSVTALRAEAEATGERSLKRTLGALNLTMLGIGAIIGAGIFVLTGLAAALHAGPAVPISFVVAAVACGLAGLCYAEMASAVPVAGSAYTYSYATLGEFVAWIIGWDLVLEYAMGAATVGVGWSGHFLSLLDFLGIHVPAKLTQAPFDFCTQGEFAAKVAGCTQVGWFATGAYLNLPAIFIVALMSYVLVVGIKESATVNNVIVITKVTIVLAVIVFCLQYVNPDHWKPFIPPNTGEWGTYGWSGVLRGASLIFFAYIGFDAVSTAAQEARNPQKDMPIGILGSLAVCTLLYVLMSATLTGLVSYKELNVAAPVALAVSRIP